MPELAGYFRRQIATQCVRRIHKPVSKTLRSLAIVMARTLRIFDLAAGERRNLKDAFKAKGRGLVGLFHARFGRVARRILVNAVRHVVCTSPAYCKADCVNFTAHPTLVVKLLWIA